jgi:hypothetical protein
MFGSFRDLAFLGAAAGSGVALDPDAQAYITAVETVDGQALEAGVRTAINDFVVGCKADGIWTAIKASCIMAGARTRLGAMVPLVGAAPTSFNFVDADYNRKTGLVGNGSTKYLSSGRASNADGANNNHMGVYVSSAPTSGAGQFPFYIGAGSGNTIANQIGRLSNNGDLFSRNSSSASDAGIGPGGSTGLIGSSRIVDANYSFRAGSTTATITRGGGPGTSQPVFIFNTSNESALPNSGTYSNARLAFYSIGESLDLALLDARVTDLINAFGAAIP